MHSRTAFEDHDVPARKRHLFRLRLSVRSGPRRPKHWGDFCGVVAVGVRRSLRGAAFDARRAAFEHCLANWHGITPPEPERQTADRVWLSPQAVADCGQGAAA